MAERQRDRVAAWRHLQREDGYLYPSDSIAVGAGQERALSGTGDRAYHAVDQPLAMYLRRPAHCLSQPVYGCGTRAEVQSNLKF